MSPTRPQSLSLRHLSRRKNDLDDLLLVLDLLDLGEVLSGKVVQNCIVRTSVSVPKSRGENGEGLTELSDLVASLVPSCRANVSVGVEGLCRRLLLDSLLDLRSRAFATVVDAEMNVEQCRDAETELRQHVGRPQGKGRRSRLDLPKVAHGRSTREDPAARGANGVHSGEMQRFEVGELVDDEAVEPARQC